VLVRCGRRLVSGLENEDLDREVWTSIACWKLRQISWTASARLSAIAFARRW
jgi:hypothetical protein